MRGINVEVIERLAKRLDLKIRYTVCPWKRCLKLMEVGKLDLIPGVLKRPEREAYMDFLAPPYKSESNKAFYLNAVTDVSIQSYEELAPYTIGVLNGAKYFARFDSDEAIKKLIVSDNSQFIPMLSKKRLDAFVGTETQIDYYLYKNNLREHVSKAAYKFQQPTAVHLTLSKKSPHSGERARFEQALAQMVESGEVKRLIEEFFIGLD